MRIKNGESEREGGILYVCTVYVNPTYTYREKERRGGLFFRFLFCIARHGVQRFGGHIGSFGRARPAAHRGGMLHCRRALMKTMTGIFYLLCNVGAASCWVQLVEYPRSKPFAESRFT